MNVPNGWRVAPIADVTIKPVKSDPATTGRETIRYVDIGLLGGPVSRLDDAPEIPSIDAPSRCRQVIMGGDTLYSTVRPYLRKVAFVGDRLDHQFASTGYSVLRPTRDIHPKFLYLFTLSQAFEESLFPLQKGMSYPAVLDKEVRSRPIWFPPLPEQRRIVEIVEEHMAHLDAADASLASAEQRAQDMLTAATNSALARSNGEEVTLEQLITSKLRNGRSVPTHPGGFPVLRLTCLTNGAEVDLTQSKEGAWDESEAEKFLVAEGDFLISRGNGSLNRVARGALVGKVERPVAIPDTIIQARPDVTKINPNYLSIAWTSTKVRRQIQSRAKTTAGIYKVSQRDLSAVMVPVPHMDDQLAMVSQLQQLRGATTRLTEQLLAHKQRSAALRRAALAAAFAGQLKTSTDPSELRQNAALR